MNRLDFIRNGAAFGMLAAAGCATDRAEPCRGCAEIAAKKGRGKCPFRLGAAGYTFVEFTLDKTLAMLRTMDVDELCAKDFHYPMTATPAQLKELVKKTSDFGVHLYGAGPISTKTEDEAKRAFEYCAVLGVPTLVGVPAEVFDASLGWKGIRSSRKMCEVCARLADEYKINFAIHNHGANPKTGNPNLYPTVEDTAKIISGLSPRIGFCVDIAYTYADGFDPSDILRRHAERVFDVHLRNVAVADNGSSGAAADHGLIDYVKIFRTLREIGYTGVCGLELANAYGKPSEINPGADPSWVPRSIGYFRGIIDAI